MINREGLRRYEGRYVHIELKNGRFYNGTVLQIIDDHVIMDERLLGETSILIGSIELMHPVQEKRGDEGG